MNRKAAERHFMYIFFVECVLYKDGAKLFNCELLDAYKKWKFKNRRENDGVKDLSPETMGRMIETEWYPKAVKRGVFRKDGQLGRGFIGLMVNPNVLFHPATKDGRIPND